jgi:predicted acylesterase/phospholipase RssA
MVEILSNQGAERLLRAETYQHPERECDVVMKGGITSGVLYPLAVCELATAYRLRNVGGTSAGAIAAAAAAAAEFGRTSTARSSGFQGLAGLPEWLGQDDHLVDLFQPSKGTRRLHVLLMRAVRPGRSRANLAVAALWFALRSRRWWIPVVCALPGVVLVMALLVADAGSALSWVGVAVAGVVAMIGLLVGSVVAVLVGSGESLADNMYGIVSGSQAIGGRESLSDWLTDQIDALAGIGSERHPLTFGDLWGGPTVASPPSTGKRAINLEMLTTNITEGRPYRLPYELSGFAFEEGEFRRLFPARVVDYLVGCAAGERTTEGLIPLPRPEQLPVVVATRMSLSFPILISAVPLYAVDRSMQEGEQEHYERCWFSDGGITSNFPVSFFDALLPSRPTFGINLRPFHPRHLQSADECQNVWMPRTNRGGIVEWWTRWPESQGVRSIMAFLRAIADTMQNWVDNQQTRVPGYRDRIVHIPHSDDEGGMNLAMPPETLAKLTERGRCAGARLVEYYTTPPEQQVDSAEPPGTRPRVVSWENHRWIRLRTSLALVADAIESLSDNFDEHYEADLAGLLEAPPSYRFTNLDQRALAQALMAGSSDPPEQPRVQLPTGLRELAAAIRAVENRGDRVPLEIGGPSPHPALRIAPGGLAARSRRSGDGNR